MKFSTHITLKIIVALGIAAVAYGIVRAVTLEDMSLQLSDITSELGAIHNSVGVQSLEPMTSFAKREAVYVRLRYKPRDIALFRESVFRAALKEQYQPPPAGEIEKRVSLCSQKSKYRFLSLQEDEGGVVTVVIHAMHPPLLGWRTC